MSVIRAYTPDDEADWLLCRLVSFFATDYYDDVKIAKTTFIGEHIELVATIADKIVGLIDVEIDGDAATIDSIAVRPSDQRKGIAESLLEAAVSRLPGRVSTVDAWTRGTISANAWYAKCGFSENYRYLHVYKNDDNDERYSTPTGLSSPIAAFMHAPIELEAELRSRHDRIYVCRQYLKEIN